MQRLEGLMRKALQQYKMIENNDHICIGVSGGKDSIGLTMALANLRNYFEHSFQITALTLDPCFGGVESDYTLLQELFEKHNIPYVIKRSNIGKVVFEDRAEQNPCSLCAKMRRGLLHDTALELGCNKIALGHHMDDAIETFYMNLFQEGRIGCFSPVTYLSRKKLTMIRPMLLATEQEVIRAVRRAGYPIVKSLCPADGATLRQHTKEFVNQKVKEDPAFRQKMLGALQKSGIDGWAPLCSGGRDCTKEEQ